MGWAEDGASVAGTSQLLLHNWPALVQVRRFARLDIDPASITWRRVIDTNDR